MMSQGTNSKHGLTELVQRMCTRTLHFANGNKQRATQLMVEFCAKCLVDLLEAQKDDAAARRLVAKINEYWHKKDIQLHLIERDDDAA